MQLARVLHVIRFELRTPSFDAKQTCQTERQTCHRQPDMLVEVGHDAQIDPLALLHCNFTTISFITVRYLFTIGSLVKSGYAHLTMGTLVTS